MGMQNLFNLSTKDQPKPTTTNSENLILLVPVAVKEDVAVALSEDDSSQKKIASVMRTMAKLLCSEFDRENECFDLHSFSR
jgi:hypothetical protein